MLYCIEQMYLNMKNLKEDIIKLKNEGYSYKEISKILHCSTSTVSYHLGEGQKEKSKNRTKKYREVIRGSELYIMRKRYDACNIINRGNKKTYKVSKFFSFDEFVDHLRINEICYITGIKIDFSKSDSWDLDHVIPVSKGGNICDLNNLKPCLSWANKMKYNFTLEELKNYCKLIYDNLEGR